ncbi:MAG: GFA family protein [Rhizomicrobium sp.]
MRRTKTTAESKAKDKSKARAQGQCLCGAVRIEIDVPAFWAWHDHSRATQRAQGCAFATYVGCWRSKVRVLRGQKSIQRFEDKSCGVIRSFCGICGTPLLYERPRAPRMVNIPRALFDTRTGREPRYHIALQDAPEWDYRGEPLVPLKSFPGVMWERSRRKKPFAAI